MTRRFASVAVFAVSALLSYPAAAQAQQTYYTYSVKFVCGFQKPITAGGETPVKTGNYATEINIHNYQFVPVPVRKKVLLLVERGEPVGREPRQVKVHAFDGIQLDPDNATMDDCFRIWELVYPGSVPPTPLPPMIGYLVLMSPEDIAVDAVYTAAAPGGAPGTLSRAISIDVERVQAKRVTLPVGAAP